MNHYGAILVSLLVGLCASGDLSLFLCVLCVHVYFYFLALDDDPEELRSQDWEGLAERPVHVERFEASRRKRGQQTDAGILREGLSDDTDDESDDGTERCESLPDTVNVFPRTPNASQDRDSAHDRGDGLLGLSGVRNRVVRQSVGGKPSDAVDQEVGNTQAKIVRFKESERDAGHPGFSPDSRKGQQTREHELAASILASHLPGSAIPGVANFKHGVQLRPQQRRGIDDYELPTTVAEGSSLLLFPLDDSHSPSSEQLGRPPQPAYRGAN